MVLMGLAGVLSVTSALLLALAPAPLAPNACSALAANDPESLDAVFRIQSSIQSGRWKYIYLHHSKTAGGDALSLTHGSQGMGDHFLIGNGDGCGDGEIQIGQRWNQQLGALPPEGVSAIDGSCVSVCLVGDLDQMKPTPLQVRRVTQLVNLLQNRLRIAPSAVTVIHQPGSAAGIGQHFPVGGFRDQLLP